MPMPAVELLVDFAGTGFTTATAEAGSPARGAGQFTNFNSCTISNAAVADRVQIADGSTATDFAYIVHFAPTNANNGAGQPAHGTLLSRKASANEQQELWYDKGNARWSLTVTHGGVAQNLVLADTWAAGAAKSIYVAGSATLLAIAVNGGAVTTAARTQTPTGLPATLDIGSVAAATQFEATYADVIVADALFTDASIWPAFAALTRPPLYGEYIGRHMAELWYGKDQTYYGTPSCIVGTELQGLDAARGRDYASQLTGKSVAGKLVATLKNNDGRYSYSNTSSPLTGLILPNRTVRLRMADATQHYSRWYGYLSTMAASAGLPSMATLTAQGALGILNGVKITPALVASALTGSLMSSVLDAAGWSASLRTLSTGIITAGPLFWNEVPALTAMRELEESEFGFIREGGDGSVIFEDLYYRLTQARQIASQQTYTDDVTATYNYQAITQEQDVWREVYNDATVDLQHYTTQALAVLWTFNGTAPTVAPGQSLTLWAQYPNTGTAVTNGAYVNAWTTPVVGTDITQTGVANGDLAVVATKFANAMKIVITNNNASATATLTLVQGRGTPATSDTPTRKVSTDAASITAYGDRTYPLPAKWLNDVVQAQAQVDYVVSRYKDPHPAVTIAIDATPSAALLTEVLTRDVSDRVTLTATGLQTNLGISEDFFVESIHDTLNAQRMMRTIMQLSPVNGDGAYWVVGYSQVGISTKVAM